MTYSPAGKETARIANEIGKLAEDYEIKCIILDTILSKKDNLEHVTVAIKTKGERGPAQSFRLGRNLSEKIIDTVLNGLADEAQEMLNDIREKAAKI